MYRVNVLSLSSVVARITVLPLVASSLLVTVACSESDDVGFDSIATSMEGIYRIDAHTENQVACEAGGESLLVDGAETHLALIKSSLFGIPLLSMLTCADPTQCRSRVEVLLTGGIVDGDYVYVVNEVVNEPSGDALAGRGASTGFSDNGTCREGAITLSLASLDGDALRFSQERTVADDYPVDSEGFCTTDLAREAAEGNSCSELITLTASYLEEL